MIVHIGYHKTGTTFLQKSVFPFMDGVQYIDFESSKLSFKTLLRTKRKDFKANDFKPFFTGTNQLYSLERLVGVLGRGGGAFEIAHKLKKAGFKRVIITIKRQDLMVESIYRQYIQQGGTLNAEEFIQEKKVFNWSYLDYEKLIAHYVKIFGADKILVIPQERLKEHLNECLSHLETFCGAKHSQHSFKQSHNRSLSYWSVRFLRYLNQYTYNQYSRSHPLSDKITTWKLRKLLQSFLDPYLISRLFKDRPFYNAEFQNMVLENYREGNQRIAHLFKLDLATYGYCGDQKTSPSEK